MIINKELHSLSWKGIFFPAFLLKLEYWFWRKNWKLVWVNHQHSDLAWSSLAGHTMTLKMRSSSWFWFWESGNWTAKSYNTSWNVVLNIYSKKCRTKGKPGEAEDLPCAHPWALQMCVRARATDFWIPVVGST